MRTLCFFLATVGLLGLVVYVNRGILQQYCILNPELTRLTTLVLLTLVMLVLVSSLYRRRP